MEFKDFSVDMFRCLKDIPLTIDRSYPLFFVDENANYRIVRLSFMVGFMFILLGILIGFSQAIGFLPTLDQNWIADVVGAIGSLWGYAAIWMAIIYVRMHREPTADMLVWLRSYSRRYGVTIKEQPKTKREFAKYVDDAYRRQWILYKNTNIADI